MPLVLQYKISFKRFLYTVFMNDRDLNEKPVEMHTHSNLKMTQSIRPTGSFYFRLERLSRAVISLRRTNLDVLNKIICLELH